MGLNFYSLDWQRNQLG